MSTAARLSPGLRSAVANVAARLAAAYDTTETAHQINQCYASFFLPLLVGAHPPAWSPRLHQAQTHLGRPGVSIGPHARACARACSTACPACSGLPEPPRPPWLGPSARHATVPGCRDPSTPGLHASSRLSSATPLWPGPIRPARLPNAGSTAQDFGLHGENRLAPHRWQKLRGHS
jgi:hypothetical protein